MIRNVLTIETTPHNAMQPRVRYYFLDVGYPHGAGTVELKFDRCLMKLYNVLVVTKFSETSIFLKMRNSKCLYTERLLNFAVF